eukprot:UN01564
MLHSCFLQTEEHHNTTQKPRNPMVPTTTIKTSSSGRHTNLLSTFRVSNTYNLGIYQYYRGL